MTLGNKVLTLNTINPNVRNVEYAVRGRIAVRADEIQKELETSKEVKTRKFERVVNCNIGNPQQLNQKPITFFRQVASLCEYPHLLEKRHEKLVSQLYSQTAIKRASLLLKRIGSVGAYSHSQGVLEIRETVATFLKNRDGYDANPNDIYLTSGASPGVQTVLSLMTQNEKTGILIPIPQYPLYSSTLSFIGATPVPYYLEEENDWALDIVKLKETVEAAREAGTDVRALVIINPGNPTGQCLEEGNIKEIIQFCHVHNLVLLADEVYQTNIYQPEERPFVSFKKALRDYEKKHPESAVELISFHSISKGMVGECGRRGGYFECCNLDKEVSEQLYKMASIGLCPNIQGQIMVDLMCNPPQEKEDAYPMYKEEMTAIYDSLKRRSKKLENAFTHMKNVTCRPAMGSMYLFPQIELPKRAIQKAEDMGMKPDEYYCTLMLEETGVCVVPGSGFGQKDGTWHFRSTFLPEEELFDKFCEQLENFHENFMETHKDEE